MGYLHDYIDFCKDMSFEQLPFNEIDGVILIKNSKPLSKGDIVKVKIVDVKEYDLIGDVIDESSK